MHFKRFLDINVEENNILIVFKNNKLIYESELKTFLLESKFLNIDIDTSDVIGIAEGDKKIYAVDISNTNTDINIAYNSLVEYDIRHLLAISKPEDIVLIGRANQLLHWIRSNKYSGYTGELNKFDKNEETLYCPSSSSMIYPTISPCVLAMITKGDEILLARNTLFPKGLYSVLAGFVEVSESAEETVEREILEEVNIKVKNIKYFGSQPWPFPSQLMLGFSCEYESGEIKVDKKEIAEANWYKFNNLPFVPPETSLSGKLISSFVLGHS
ncbi:MAG: NAD(+) diphosphatase [Gammaproteobacteria bacterium]|nr:NAD(+) diphosphatase [Gammaproteobacteria bacterium]|tara:strand:- start:992 stop:1804 length:813 start_codon:yes stop_codon:yes gene_type:complete